jgi:hypothetical protein
MIQAACALFDHPAGKLGQEVFAEWRWQQARNFAAGRTSRK